MAGGAVLAALAGLALWAGWRHYSERRAEEPIGTFLARHWAQPIAPQGNPPDHFTPPEAALGPEGCGGIPEQAFIDTSAADMLLSAVQNDSKWDLLRSLLQEMRQAVFAYSGGVDSSLLLKAAADAMGPGLIAVTADSATYPQGELEQSRSFAQSLGVSHRIIPTKELDAEEFVTNPPDRCYYC